MIIPVRCFTCGKVISGKWKKYLELKDQQPSTTADDEEKAKQKQKNKNSKTLDYFDDDHMGEILNRLGVTKMCCRRHLLTHVDLVDMI